MEIGKQGMEVGKQNKVCDVILDGLWHHMHYYDIIHPFGDEDE